jgi:hypothetical protein
LSRMDGHPVVAMLTVVMLAAGCSGAVASIQPAPSASSSPHIASAEIPAATPAPAATPTALLRPSPLASAAASAVTVDEVAVTAIDALRVRSKPRVSDDSHKFDPLLPLGTPLYVLDGPVSASGYTWYEVAPLGSRSLPQGWVAAADRSGESWLTGGDLACPRVPTDFRTLAMLPPAVGLACFRRVPISVSARLIGCNCDVDGGWLTPEWFSLGTGGPEMLVEPEMTRPPNDVGEWFWLNLDPAGQHAKALPMDQVVEVTGMFDHPGAASCTFTEMDGKPAPSQRCRLAFAVTQLVTAGS